MRLFLFAGCIGIFLATFAVQVLPGIPLLYVSGLGLMGAGALGCVLVSLPQLLTSRKPRFQELQPPRADHFAPVNSANQNTAPLSKRTAKQMAR
ncbi:hypothetical protein Q5Y75_09590 [Ruegeria sp. 2205SS24-7]|uniref:hypothetical protein n=1 Tax=Ruegeria discodermiae TaxID=3064389 RepID=UPI00274075FD|nr:hypothetical protein [Ruegeria sp. 2205SS24-7]MDP5217468.1 hypothetical protein [Ruegeria sp. 2205SS24-7]